MRPALERTFRRYLDEIATRRDGSKDWTAYSPYELRNVEALVELGWRDDAHGLLDWIVADRRPPGWNEWAEISYRDPTAPQFIGDMPHTWVGCIFVHALRTMLVHERESDHSLVVGAGVPSSWIGRGVTALGGGRTTMEDKLDLSVGFVISARPGDWVEQGEPLATIFARDRAGVDVGRTALRSAITIAVEADPPLPLVSHRVTSAGVELLAGR
jgi:hypothetical protein